MGAAAFALGVLFAAPQAAVASAAPAGSDSADGSAQAGGSTTADASPSTASRKAVRGSGSQRTVSQPAASSARRPAATIPVSTIPDAPAVIATVAQDGAGTAPVARSAPRAAGHRGARTVPVAPSGSGVLASVPEVLPVETSTAATPVVTATPEGAPARVGLPPGEATAASLTPLIFRPALAALPAPAAALTSAPVAGAVAAKNALATASTNPFGDFVSGLLLMIRQMFTNRVPTASPKVAMVRPDGQVWGLIAGSDPDGDPISYGIRNKPKYGTVTVDRYGVYTYTPGAAFTGTDSFTATVTDGIFHLNLVNLLNGGKTLVNVTVNAKAADPAGTVSDTFSGSAGSPPNPALWNITTGQYVDSGVQTYTATTDNVRLDGQGHLVLQARTTADGYTSGEVTTKGKVDTTYGATTARIKFPAGQGIWPAFWMLGSTYSYDTWDAPGPTGWPGAGEIDVMELVNKGTTYHVALHGPQASDGADYYSATGGFVGATGPIGDLTTAYHDYWVIRAPNLIVVGVDDNRLATFTPASLPADGTWVFNTPMYTTLNLAVGGTWPGPPDATTSWPTTMLVDSYTYTPLT